MSEPTLIVHRSLYYGATKLHSIYVRSHLLSASQLGGSLQFVVVVDGVQHASVWPGPLACVGE
ncbi:hypothetical protein D1O33_09860 [Rhodococcus rhodochrous]|nr:hypothetical protein D1O33_09860 [Rhodococcus rhodochrous]